MGAVVKQPLFLYICTMSKEDEILYLLRENNKMLKEICVYLSGNHNPDFMEDFVGNVIANIIGNKITPQR